MPLPPGTRLGPYEVGVQIGAGGMAQGPIPLDEALPIGTAPQIVLVQNWHEELKRLVPTN